MPVESKEKELYDLIESIDGELDGIGIHYNVDECTVYTSNGFCFKITWFYKWELGRDSYCFYSNKLGFKSLTVEEAIELIKEAIK